MTTEEKKIEEAAKDHSLYDRGICDDDDRLCNLSEQMFILGAKSDAAKEYHAKSLCTKEEVLSFFEKYEPNLAVTILKSEFVEWFDKNKTV